jgi:hypothetical protein
MAWTNSRGKLSLIDYCEIDFLREGEEDLVQCNGNERRSLPWLRTGFWKLWGRERNVHFAEVRECLPFTHLWIAQKRTDGVNILRLRSKKGNRLAVGQRVPGGLGSHIFMTFGTWRWWGQTHAPAAFTPRKCSWYSFSLGHESTPGPWNGRKEYVTEKSSDTTGNRSRDRPTSSVAP